MMPRSRRPENKGLPARWQFEHGAYYYRVRPGEEKDWDGYKRFPLGKTLSEAHTKMGGRAKVPAQIHTIGQLLDRYLIEVVPTKAPKTQKGNREQIANLRTWAGHWLLLDLKPKHIYQYIDERTAKTNGRKEISTLSHVFTKAAEWGVVDRHPFKGEVRLKGIQPRTRYIEDWEIVECLSLAARMARGSVLMVQAYIRLKLSTGLSRGDLLRLPSQFPEDGIHVKRHKTAKTTGKKTIYEWTTQRRNAVKEALAARPVDISPWLFCKRDGKGYVNEYTGEAPSWDKVWQNFMNRVLKETKVIERFTEHDIRAKVGSDAESLEKARALLSHADSNTTLQVYRRKPERV